MIKRSIAVVAVGYSYDILWNKINYHPSENHLNKKGIDNYHGF